MKTTTTTTAPRLAPLEIAAAAIMNAAKYDKEAAHVALAEIYRAAEQGTAGALDLGRELDLYMRRRAATPTAAHKAAKQTRDAARRASLLAKRDASKSEAEREVAAAAASVAHWEWQAVSATTNLDAAKARHEAATRALVATK